LDVVVRGEVWLTRLDPTEGREIRKIRPSLIISPPELHDYLDVAIIAPMTTGSRPTSYRLPVRFSGKQGYILLDQIRTVDKRRLVRRLGRVSARELSATLALLQELFAE
jgi:mRNA interferase MazF